MHFDKKIADNGDITHYASGLRARKSICSNAVEIRSHYRFNGSGEKAFGGAKKWPAIDMQVSFQEGEESKRNEFVEALKIFLNRHLHKP